MHPATVHPATVQQAACYNASKAITDRADEVLNYLRFQKHDWTPKPHTNPSMHHLLPIMTQMQAGTIGSDPFKATRASTASLALPLLIQTNMNRSMVSGFQLSPAALQQPGTSPAVNEHSLAPVLL